MLNSIEEALEDIKQGKIIIVVDDEDRENEGDFILAAEYVTPEKINFLITEGRGLVCMPIEEKRAEELKLPLMVEDNTVLHQTQFTVSVDLIGNGCTTGISAQDRSKTIQAIIDSNTLPTDLGRPGHIFPLKAKPGGVLRRAGHTEAAVDLAKLAGLYPAGVIVEILNADGTMARLPQLRKLAEKWDLKIVSIQDLITHRLQNESQIEWLEAVDMPTKFGHFKLHLYKQILTEELHMALVKGDINTTLPVLARVHSSCVTGDILHSLRCDCGEQLEAAMSMIEAAANGVILYMNQEGRGIGLHNKLKAYKLQEEGLDTVDANLQLGFKMDERDYGIGAQILRHLGITKIKLISNNPRKRVGLKAHGLEITESIPIQIKANPFNAQYLKTKKEKLGHELS